MAKEAKVYKFCDMLRNGNATHLGKRSFPQGLERMEYFWPSFTWYHPGAYSIPHSHPNIEAMYYFTFEGEGTHHGRLFLGWPYSEAKEIIITEPTLITVPQNVAHSFENDGEAMMGMLCCYAQPHDSEVQYINDIWDVIQGKYFMSGDEQADFANMIYDACPTMNDMFEWLKKQGKY